MYPFTYIAPVSSRTFSSTLQLCHSRIGSIRKSSSASLVGQLFTGKSGRSYLRTNKIQFGPPRDGLSIYVAETEDGRKFILKRVRSGTYKRLQGLQPKFENSSRIRTHIDENEEECTFVYEHLTNSLLYFMRLHNATIPFETAHKIMWEVGKGLEELHDNHIMHVDLKPDNILVDWEEPQLSTGAVGFPTVNKVVISDLDSFFELEPPAWCIRTGDDSRDVRFNNIRWRPPEMQTGLGFGLFSDVYVYGLVYLYLVTGQIILGEEDYDELAKQTGIPAEHLALARTMEHFGPVTPEFLKHTKDERWEEQLNSLQAMVDANCKDTPENHFRNFNTEDFPHLVPPVKEMLGKVFQFSPKARPTMTQVMADPCWEAVNVRDRK